MQKHDNDVLGYFDLELPYAGMAEMERDQAPPPSDQEDFERYIPFSMDSPYLTTGQYCDIPTKTIDTEVDYLGCDNRYLSPLVTCSKMVDDAAVLGLLRSELEAIFHESTVAMVRFERFTFTDKWRSMYGAGVGMSSFNDKHATLHRNHFRPRHRFSRIPQEDIKYYFNKHFAIYFQRTEGTEWTHLFHTGISSRGMGCYVHRHYVRMHNGRPPCQRHHFLAKPIQFVHKHHYKGIYEHGITDLSYALTFHESLCNSVAAQEDRLIPGQQPWYRKKTGVSSIPLQHRDPNFAPCPRKGPLSYRQHGYQLLPLFRALFMIVDGRGRDKDDKGELWRLADYEIEPPPEWGRRDKWGRDPRQERDADWYASRQRVLLVRTGDDSHLSAPVSFGPLFTSCRALPLGREDCRDLGEDVVRVRLDHALEFVEGLIRREEEALPQVREAAEALEDEVDELCEEWIDRVLEHATRVGFNVNGFTWHASCRVRARLNGEAFDVEQILPEHESVARWYRGGPG